MQAVGTVPCFVFAVPADSPHDHASTSISPLCTLSVDSPWMPSTFRNMSTAAMALVDASAVAASTPAVNKPVQLRRFIVVLSKRVGPHLLTHARALAHWVPNAVRGDIRPVCFSLGFET